MKTTTTLLMAFCTLTFFSLSQNEHDHLEELFGNKTLAAFEHDLNLTNDELNNHTIYVVVDERYQSFFSSIRSRVHNGETVSKSDFDAQYENEVSSTRSLIDNLPPSSSPPNYSPKMLNGPCVNMDFEEGDFNGWELTRGDVDGSMPYSYVNEFVTGPGPYHQIFTGGVDPVTGVPRVFPGGGGNSVRLGNGVGTGARAAKMQQTFLVDATNYIYTYSYAVVFESPNGHTNNQLPYFTVRVFDENGNNVPCGEYSVIADAATASDYQSTNWGGETILYQDWQTVFTNLSAYIGQNVTIEFTSGDCSLTGHFGYAYVDASCDFGEITASNDLICTGDNAVLTAPPGAANYLWSNGDTGQTTTVTSGGNYTCTLTPFQGGGCEIVLDIDILENPTPTANFTADYATICLSESISFTDASSIPAPGNITLYQWDFGDGTTTPLSSGAIAGVLNTTGSYTLPSHTYTTPGNYTVSLYVESADGCSDTYTINVTVNDTPIVVAGVDQVVCEGTSVILNGSGAQSYTWNNGVSNGISFVPGVGTTTYTVMGTDANGCQNTDEVDVTVNPLPTVSAGNDLVVCEGTSTTLTGSGASTYIWDNGVTDGVAFIQSSGTINYTVTGTDANGCENSDIVSVIVNPLPLVSAGSDVVVCENEPITLLGSGAQSYVWDNGVVDNVSFIQLPGTMSYTVVGTDANGCQNTDQVDVTVNPLPAVDAGNDVFVCQGTSVILNANGATSYLWDNGVVNGVSFGQPVGTVVYSVVGTDANGCENSDFVQVTVYPLPTIDAGSNIQVCEGETVMLIGSGAQDYLWDNGVVDGVGFVPSLGSTTYTLLGTDVNGCVNTDDVTVLVNPLPTVNAGPDQTLCELVEFTLSGSGATTYTWDNNVIDGVAFNQAPGTTTYTVVGTDDNGCQSSDDVTVVVNALPIVDAGNDIEVCEETVINLSGTGANTYAWNYNVTNGIDFIQPVGTITYTVTGIDANGCQNTDQVTVLVNPNPIVEAGMPQSICDGSEIILNAVGSPAISWSNGVIDGVPFQQQVGTQFYTVTDVYPTGCWAVDSVAVTVMPNPVISADDVVVCQYDGVELYGEGGVSYEWDQGVIDGETFYPDASGVYTVIGTGANGCFSEATAYVTVNPVPFANFKILDLTLTTVDPTTGFDNLSTGATTYDWNFGDNSANSSEFEPTHTFPDHEPGEYEVVLTAYSDQGCPARAIKYVRIFSDYTIYVPNAFTPDRNGVNEMFKPVMEGFDENKYTLYIFNRWGNLIFESHDMEVGWDGSFRDPNNRVQDGVFTWKIEAGLKYTGDMKVFVGHVTILK